MKQKIILTISILLGLFAAFLTGQYISSRERLLAEEKARFDARNETTPVIVPKQSLPAGAQLRREDLSVLELPKRALRGQVVHYTENAAQMLEGRRLVLQIERGKPLLWSDIEGGAPEERGLAGMVRPQMRALSVSVSAVTSVSNMVRPTDHVDVIGTFTLPSKTSPGEQEMVTMTILQDVLVLATGQTTAQQQLAGARTRDSYNMVTLEVSPHEAEVLAFTEQMRGRITLALRNPEDISYEKELPKVNFEHIRATLENLNKFRQEKVNRKRN